MSSNTNRSNTSLEEYVVRIVQALHYFPEIEMKNGFGKIQNKSNIATFVSKSVGRPVAMTNPAFNTALELAVNNEWLIHIKTKKGFAPYFASASYHRGNYNAPAYVLTETGEKFAKAITFLKFDLSDILKSVLGDKAHDEDLKQISDLFKDEENPFLELKKLKIFKID
jgi:hypothetical protein